MNFFIQMVIQLVVLLSAVSAGECDNILAKFLLFFFACLEIEAYHKFMKKIEKEDK